MYLVNSDCAVWAKNQYETNIYAHCFNMCGTVDLIWYRQYFNCVLSSLKTPDLLLACLDSQSLIAFWSFQWWPDVQICRLFHYGRNEG